VAPFGSDPISGGGSLQNLAEEADPLDRKITEYIRTKYAGGRRDDSVSSRLASWQSQAQSEELFTSTRSNPGES
jgi:hypothetical protein